MKVGNILFYESEHVPKFGVWDSLDAFKLTQEQCNEIEMVPPNKFFEIPENGSAFGTVNMLYDAIRAEGDKTVLKKVAFKYVVNNTTGVTYLFILSMTNKCTRRSKETPFIFEYIFKCSQNDLESEGSDDYEGRVSNLQIFEKNRGVH